MSADLCTGKQAFSITELGEKSGVNPVTLRAWERRYGLLKPKRNERGYRVYDAADYARVLSVLGWMEKGVAIGRIQSLFDDAEPSFDGEVEDESLVLALECLGQGDLRRLERVYETWLRSYPQAHIINHKWRRLFSALRHQSKPGSESATALLMSFIEQKMQARLLKHLPSKRHPGILLIPVGEDYSLNSLFVHVMLTQAGAVPVTRLSIPVSAAEYPCLASCDLYCGVVFVVSTEMTATAITNHLHSALKHIAKPVAILGDALPDLHQLTEGGGSNVMVESGTATAAVSTLKKKGWLAEVVRGDESNSSGALI